MTEISEPKATPKPLTEKEMQGYVKDLLAPMIDKFIEDHKGKPYTNTDIEDLYENLDNSLSKDPRIKDKSLGRYAARKEMAAETAKEINEAGKLSIGNKLLQGFGNFCEKIGLKAIGAACHEHVKKATLTNELGKIAKKVASTKTSINVGDSKSSKVAKPIKNDSLRR